MTTTVRDKKLNRVKSSQTVNRSTKSIKSPVKKDTPRADAVGLSALMGLNLPRTFATPADVDAYIRSLRDE